MHFKREQDGYVFEVVEQHGMEYYFTVTCPDGEGWTDSIEVGSFVRLSIMADNWLVFAHDYDFDRKEN